MTSQTPETLACPDCGRRITPQERTRQGTAYQCRCGSRLEPVVDFAEPPLGDRNVPDDEPDEIDANVRDVRDDAAHVVEDEGAPGIMNPRELPR